ncbi:probable leucine-rich repeat receptor-like serine/threonine-protein kinase At3g14840 isoform X2 [Corylus avellana]|uniref:probable leucine-rich repeat receptor-like serine/threonine-protein kinase At3g14840 isoform X2 n=1 Tax=Corylus avellana TaxID=13451 RepID=UPI00286D1CEE|nr:probable leucine-rich repeat receptor-like serine/threonine-protein kinase At3g14840 isoform X2 [Corylus avellana]
MSILYISTQLCKWSWWKTLVSGEEMAARCLPYVCFIVLLILLRICMEAQAGLLGPTPDEEVEALGEIARKLGKKDWKFSKDPCLNDSTSSYNNSVSCNCHYPGGVCHIELMSFTGNNLSGPIPNYLGNITTLEYLSIENNLFSGTVPPELGNLDNLETLILSANNLIGELPATLTRLNKLRELICGNNFTRKLPDFFRSWKQLEKLETQGSGLNGPIPASISVLKDLTDLRISDLHGEGSDFLPLMNMRHMKELKLSSCNISGEIPAYIPNMTHLGKLDLSFNRLEKEIPEFEGLKNLTNMYLTSNLLTGDIPNWIRNSNQYDFCTKIFQNFARGLFSLLYFL